MCGVDVNMSVRDVNRVGVDMGTSNGGDLDPHSHIQHNSMTIRTENKGAVGRQRIDLPV